MSYRRLIGDGLLLGLNEDEALCIFSFFAFRVLSCFDATLYDRYEDYLVVT